MDVTRTQKYVVNTGGGYAEVRAGLGLSLRNGCHSAEVLPHAVWAEIGLSLRKCAEANRRALELASPDPRCSRPRTAHRSRASSGRCLRTLRGLPGPISGQNRRERTRRPAVYQLFWSPRPPNACKIARAIGARAKIWAKILVGTRSRLRKLRAILAAKSAEVLFGCGSAWERLRLRKWSGPQNHTSPL